MNELTGEIKFDDVCLTKPPVFPTLGYRSACPGSAPCLVPVTDSAEEAQAGRR